MSSLESPTLEVVIPAYNAADFIYDTLHHLAQQTRPSDIITVVNDRSTDRTLEIVTLAAREMSDRVRIRIMENVGPRGPSAARNTAIRNSNADIIALMDSDDIAEARHHEKLLSILQTCGNCVLAFGNSLVFDKMHVVINDMFERSGISQQDYIENNNKFKTMGEKIFCLLTNSGVFTTSACAFKRTSALKVGLFDEEMRYSEDTDFSCDYRLKGIFTLRMKLSHVSVFTKAISQIRKIKYFFVEDRPFLFRGFMIVY